MYFLIAQLPDVPKTGDVTQWFGWLAALMATLVLGAIVYLVTTASKDRQAVSESSNRLEGVFKDTIKDLMSINMAQREEHKTDRDNALKLGEKVVETQAKLAETQTGIIHHLEKIDTRLETALKPKEPHG